MDVSLRNVIGRLRLDYGLLLKFGVRGGHSEGTQ